MQQPITDTHDDPTPACRTGCSGYGSRTHCPPLIVIASLLADSSSEQLLEQSRYPDTMEPGLPTAHFGRHLASAEFCRGLSFHGLQFTVSRSTY